MLPGKYRANSTMHHLRVVLVVVGLYFHRFFLVMPIGWLSYLFLIARSQESHIGLIFLVDTLQ